MKLRFLAVLMAASAIAAPAFAQAPAPAAPATPAPVTTPLTESQMRLSRELIESTGIARSFDGAVPDIALRIRQNFAASRPDILQDMDDTLVALIPEIRTRRAEVIERSARSLGSLFTEAELTQLSAFFASPVGKKYVSVQPQLLQQIFAAMEPWIQQTSDFFLTRFREEMRKKGHTV
jgi:hypothetical protein